MMRNVSIFLAMSLLASQAAEPIALAKEYWQDESFRKSFNASYRINARIEPTVESQERALLVQVESLMAKGKREDALKLLQVDAVKSSAALLYNRANIQFELGALEKAQQDYESAIKLYPSFRRAHRNLGLVFLRAEDPKKAMVSLQEAVRLGDQDGATMGALGYCYLDREQYASAMQAYRQASMLEPESVDWKAGIAQCLSQVDKDEEAIVLLNEVIEQRPDEPSYQILAASICLKLGEGEKAVTHLELLRRQGKLDQAQRILLASLYLSEYDARLARPLIEEIIKEKKITVAKDYLGLVERLTAAGEWELAAKALEAHTFQEMATDEQHHRLRLAALIAMERKQPGAKDLLGKILEKNPNDGEALLLMARFYQQSEEHELAALQYERAAKIESCELRAYLSHGKMLVDQKRYAAALPLLEKASKLDESVQLKKYIHAVEQLERAQ